MRVAVIAAGDPGHVFPAAALTLALIRRGHQATLSTGARWVPALERDAIPVLAMPVRQLPVHEPPGPDAEPDPVRGLRRVSRRLAPLIAGQLTSFAPDLVVADVVTPSGGLVAGLLEVPWLQLVPHVLQDPSPHLSPAGSGLAPARGPIGRLRDQRLYKITSAQWALGDEQRDQDRAALGLPPSGAPRARLIASLPALEAARPDWPDDAHLVGPLEWDPARGELAPPPGDGPLVLLSATTVAGAATGLAAATLAGLEGTGVRVAWTVLDQPGHVLPNWVSAGPGRQDSLIEQAAAVICGGGHGILAKALGRGRPVVTVPSAGAGEQRENADRVRRSGLGVQIMPQRLTPERLAAAVQQVLTDPGFALAATACRPPEHARSSADRAVDVIERTADL